ncbi:MAG: Sulfocyanin (SoxE) domain [Solirubrobacteraceae bacterium]|nr:Sulfocyanin (SoxE) domain [Solirubrobacteraceae bacterium]
MSRLAALAALVGAAVGTHAPGDQGARPLDPAPVLGPPTPVMTATPTPTVAVTPIPTPQATATLPPQSTKSVSVGATEYAFTLTQRTVDAGPVKVQFDLSRAADPHQLVIVRDGELISDSGKQAATSVTKQTVTLSAGVYELVCPLPDHEALGMRAELTVR